MFPSLLSQPSRFSIDKVKLLKCYNQKFFFKWNKIKLNQHYFLVDITFWLTSFFGWQNHWIPLVWIVLNYITFCFTLLFGWHYFLVGIAFWFILIFGWLYFLFGITFTFRLTLLFCWHYFLVDFTFWLTLLFG